jgi:ribonuclease HI
MMHIEVYTDGSATIATKPGGYGYVIVVDGNKWSEGSGYLEKASNNDAELEAAVQGLRAAYQIFGPPISVLGGLRVVEMVPPSVTLVSDSQLILGWANGSYRFRQQDKIEKFKEFQLLVNLMMAGTRWVEGHTGDEHNERCDKLANEARLGVEKKEEKLQAIVTGKTLIGNKKTGVVCLYYKNTLKIIDLDQGVVEDYNREVHGSRGSMLEIREDKLR